MSRVRNSEQAPLLADDAPIEDGDSDVAIGGEESSKRNVIRNWLANAWHWVLNNYMVLAIILLLLGGIIALCVYFAVTNNAKPSPKLADICLTPACVLAASEILDNMSPRYHEIDPCTGFDKFVCDGWVEKHDLRADQGSSFTGTIMAENAQQILRHVLESPSPTGDQRIEMHSAAKQKIFQKLHEAYDACMNEDIIKDLGAVPLLDVLRKIEKVFPAPRPDENSGASSNMPHSDQAKLSFSEANPLSKTITYLTSIGVNAIVAFYVGADDKDPDVVVPSVRAPRQPGLPSKEYYKDPKLVAEYGQMIGQVLEALLQKSKPPSALLKSVHGGFSTKNAELVESIVLFESKLAKATPATEEAMDVTKYYNPRTIDETEALLPQLSIKYLISTLAPPGYSPKKLIVGSPSYLETVSAVLKDTSLEALQAYFVWKTVQAYAYKVKDDALKPLMRFNNRLQGNNPDAEEERWRTCIKVADNGLGWILSKFFIEKAFSEEAKDFGDRIVSDIRVQFIKKLKRAEWMSTGVRKLGIEKVHNIVQKIGYPTKSPDIRDSSALLEYYEPVNVSSTTFFSNALSIAKFDTKQEWSALGKPTNRDEWGMTAETVNAYYNPAGNEIVFPAGIMQAPVFYGPRIPQYLSYGAFGSVSGHELSHAFDSTGRHYDETGNFTDWWNADTVKAFEKKAQCFVDQYHGFTVPNPNGKPLHVNGRLTLGENIADAGGLNAAFAAWKKLEEEEPEMLLPGLQHFSKEQMFFISYSNWWCGKTRPETAVNLVYRDPHSPTWARILGTMANSRDFKEAFNCPIKEPVCELCYNSDLISAPLGSRILSFSDEFFASASNLTTPTPPIRRPGHYIVTGAWYDGWETRRHNPTPPDYVIMRLGPAAGIVRGVEIDTAFFDGNHAEGVEVYGTYEVGDEADEKVKAGDYKGWKQVLGKRACWASRRHAWRVDGDSVGEITHVRLCMWPDGGIARFRLPGVAVPVWPEDAKQEVELSAAIKGGVAVEWSDQHFGAAGNLLLPGRGKDMGDGWETKRSREKGHEDWVVVKLGPRGRVSRVVVDTMHFRGNFPQAVRVEGLDAKAGEVVHGSDERWVEVVSMQNCEKDKEHEFCEGMMLNAQGETFTHMKMTIIPDGGVKRFRVFGTRA